MFSSKNFRILDLIFKSVINFELTLYTVQVVPNLFLAFRYVVVLVSFVQKTTLSPLNGFGTCYWLYCVPLEKKKIEIPTPST